MPSKDDVPSKDERLAEFFRRLVAAAPAASFDEAYSLVCTTLEQVEDELSGLPNEPDKWMSLDRLFPPQSDRMSTIEGTGIKRFDSLRHITYVGPNGAIEIRSSRDATAAYFSKPGRDGRSICDVDPRLRDANL